ncbi:MAG TPA: hypothetical protein VFE14_20875 [Micromonosporaceae bacterium]|jgi:hypothetical protein|nr:hypothetical protein [Micromonosporaceae bacterium]
MVAGHGLLPLMYPSAARGRRRRQAGSTPAPPGPARTRDWDGSAGFDQIVVCAPGACATLDGGPITVAVYWKPEEARSGGLLIARAGGANQWGINYEPSAGSVQYFHAPADFTGGPIGPVGEYQIIAFGKDSGAAVVRWHLWTQATGWMHFNGLSTGDNTAPDEIRLGWAFNRMDGNGAVFAVWAANLADAVLDASTLPTLLSGWSALSPAALWPCNQLAATDPIVDITGGGADQTSVIGTAPPVSADVPPGFIF